LIQRNAVRSCWRIVKSVKNGRGTHGAEVEGDDMNVFQKLMHDHRISEQLFAEIERTSDKETERRKQLFRELRAGLEAHETLEEEILYPEIEQSPSTKLVIGDALEAHAEFDAVLQEISEIPANKSEWTDRIHELREMIYEHVRMEEETLFPAAGTQFSETRAEELGQQIEERTRNI
jgi:hemerythrin superfamily protein